MIANAHICSQPTLWKRSAQVPVMFIVPASMAVYTVRSVLIKGWNKTSIWHLGGHWKHENHKNHRRITAILLTNFWVNWFHTRKKWKSILYMAWIQTYVSPSEFLSGLAMPNVWLSDENVVRSAFRPLIALCTGQWW